MLDFCYSAFQWLPSRHDMKTIRGEQPCQQHVRCQSYPNREGNERTVIIRSTVVNLESIVQYENSKANHCVPFRPHVSCALAGTSVCLCAFHPANRSSQSPGYVSRSYSRQWPQSMVQSAILWQNIGALLCKACYSEAARREGSVHDWRAR